MKNHNVNLEQNKFVCSKCEVNFPGRLLLEEHYLNDHSEEFIEDANKIEFSLNCNVCQKYFSDSSALNRHRQMVHFKAGICYCDYCMKPFSRKSTLKIHFKSCLMKRNKQFSMSCEDVKEPTVDPSRENSLNNLSIYSKHQSCYNSKDILLGPNDQIFTTSQKNIIERDKTENVTNIQKIFNYDNIDMSCQNIYFFDKLVDELDSIDDIFCESPIIADLPIVRIENLSQASFDNIFQRIDGNIDAEAEVKIVDLLNYFKNDDSRTPNTVFDGKFIKFNKI
jgi:hypothetical protein